MRSLYLSLVLAITAPALASSVDIVTTTLPNGIVNKPYYSVIHAGGGCAPYKWTIDSGSLPAGVSFTVSTKTTALKLAGTPTTASAQSFTIKVTGCHGYVSSVSYNIVIQATPNHVVDLNWKASTSPNIAGYNVYRGPDGVNWRKVNSSLIGSTVYTDAAVANQTDYFYTTTAVNLNGQESPRSTVVYAAVP